MKLLMVLVVLVVVFAALGAAASPAQAQVSEMLINISDGSLSGHGCDSSEWHFVINQLADPSLAPATIHVAWSDGSEEDVPLQNVTPGGMAHYATAAHLDSYVVDATAYIYTTWGGKFNLSHGPCGNTETPTVTVTVTETVTQTPTITVTETPTNTPTVTETPTETVTITNTPTGTVTQTGTPTETVTQTQTPTVTTTGTPNETGTPTGTVTETLVNHTPTEPSLGGGKPESTQTTFFWPAIIGLVVVALFVVFKKH